LAGSRAVVLVVATIVQGRDAAYIFAISDGDEEIGRRVSIVRVLAPVHDIKHIHPDRRHPLRTILVETELDVNEAPDLVFLRRINLYYL
jgi:hypothetical protein